ncbi:MAG: T9SS type A sorting domain-containing protein, partial [Bacteroidota bacterium]
SRSPFILNEVLTCIVWVIPPIWKTSNLKKAYHLHSTDYVGPVVIAHLLITGTMKKVLVLLFLQAGIFVFTSNLAAQASNGALPATINVSASLTGDNKVAISWVVLAKLTTDYFEVEKSNDGISWRSIALVKVTDNSTVPNVYNVLDAFPLKGANFYQVRIKSLSGNTSFTPIKSVRVNSLCRINIYPNPSSDLVTICLGEVSKTDWNIAVFSSSGQLMTQRKFSKSLTSVSLPVGNYPTGHYILELVQDGSMQTNRLMINHR